MGESSHKPYAAFGQQLRRLREKANESLDEVAGSVEINKEELARIEKGEIRPSEDVLMLLITHFNAAERDAAKLWEQAGYSKANDDPDMTQQQTVIISAVDSRIIYTDVVHVAANDFGVIMNFMQNTGNGKPLAIARVGMSIEHAKSVLRLLQDTLNQVENQDRQPKRLTSGDDKRS